MAATFLKIMLSQPWKGKNLLVIDSKYTSAGWDIRKR